METRAHYHFVVRMKPKTYKNSQLVNTDQPRTFPVNFLLYKRQIYYSLHGEEFFATDRRPESISRKTIHIPVGDSPRVALIPVGGLYMLVIIRKTVYDSIRFLNEEDDIARAQRESMGAEARPIPATKSSIDALERVVFDVPAAASDCAVCLEEISAGSEVIPMPCSHVYHSDCIVKWLQTSHSCPLCRYNMPFE
ncbi:F6A14.12 PROTEIN-RELATED [Salix viminalis]|uniref:RING-type E3 ubiquitin transferase n=1 Tax=Salix viminalis TaxID=40686 RepID=A0A9Q0NXS7_SALVM|nr:F6A14.12 PROTEIN-RELATED [Salix viminalis]